MLVSKTNNTTQFIVVFAEKFKNLSFVNSAILIYIDSFIPLFNIMQLNNSMVLETWYPFMNLLQSSQIGSEHDLHQCFAMIDSSSRLQNKQYLTKSFSVFAVMVHTHLFSGRLFAQSSLEISFSGSCTRFLHTGQSTTLKLSSLSRVVVLDMYV